MTNVPTSKNFPPDKLLAGLIARIRSTNELTQISFGQLFQPPVTQSTIARWESGEQKPDRIHFPKIAYFLDLTLDELQQLLENTSLDVESQQIEKKTFTPNKNHLKLNLSAFDS